MNPDIPDRQIWSRVAEDGLKPAEFGTFTTPLVRKSDTLAAVGTLLASRLLVAMRGKRFPAVRVESPHPVFADIPPEDDEYRSFSAGYGEIWSARALRQLVRRADRSFAPKQDRWRDGDVVVDPYRPRLRYPARSDQEFDLLLDRHANAVRSAFRRCSTLLVALGASEICEAIDDGAVVPIVAGSQAPGFDPDLYAFRTLTIAETVADLNDAIEGLRGLNPGMAIVLMVSPEPPAATATPAHIVSASAYGKAILRVAMEDVARQQPGVSYFPALEIAATLGNAAVTPGERTLTSKAISLVGAALLEASEGGSFVMTAPGGARPDDAAVAEEGATSPPDAPEAEAASTTAEVAADAPDAEAATATAEVPVDTVQDPAVVASAPRKRVVATVVDAYSNTVPKRGSKKKGAGGSSTGEESEAAKLRRERLERKLAREAKKASARAAASEKLAAKKTITPADAAAAAAEKLAARAQKHQEIRERKKEWEAKRAENLKARTAPSSSREAPVSEKSAAARPAKKDRAKASGSRKPTAKKAAAVQVASTTLSDEKLALRAKRHEEIRGRKEEWKARLAEKQKSRAGSSSSDDTPTAETPAAAKPAKKAGAKTAASRKAPPATAQRRQRDAKPVAKGEPQEENRAEKTSPALTEKPAEGSA